MRVLCDGAGIDEAERTVRAGGVIVFPTDTVYGMGCNPFDADAVAKIYELKRRRESKSFPVLGHSADELGRIADLGGDLARITDKLWPGPLTIVTRVQSPQVRDSLGLDEKIAVRVPDNRCALWLLRRCGPLVGTSANISGQAPFTDPAKCPEPFCRDATFVDGGVINSAGASTIMELDGSHIRILRQGELTEADILRALGRNF